MTARGIAERLVAKYGRERARYIADDRKMRAWVGRGAGPDWRYLFWAYVVLALRRADAPR